MNLIKKLGAQFFQEKFQKGLFLLENKLYVLIRVDVAQENKKNKPTALDLAKLELQVAANARANHWDTEPSCYLDDDDWASYEDRDVQYEDHSPVEYAEEVGIEVNPEFLKWLEEKKKLQEAEAEAMQKVRALREVENETETHEVVAIDFEEAEEVRLHEDLFESIRMFWDFETGYRVLPYKKKVGANTFIGPKSNGDRCIKISIMGALDDTFKASTRELRNYGFYLENQRWKCLLKSEEYTLDEAFKLLKEELEETGTRGNLLLTGGKALLSNDSGEYRILFEDTVIAVPSKEGKIEKLKKTLYEIAAKKGVVPCLQ